MKKNKTWVKSKVLSLVCGYCLVCNKQLDSDMGGWIVTHKKQRFCHNGKEGSCFDKYCMIKLRQKDINEKNTQNKIR